MLGVSAMGLVLLGGCGLPRTVSQAAKVPRVGFVGDPADASWVKPLWDRLGELGWVDGQTLRVEPREGRDGSRILAAVTELIALPVDVLVTVGTPTTLAAKQATQTIPIVFTNVTDPVGVEIVANLARPGGNVTGVSQGASTPLWGKKLELLGALVPGLARVAVIHDATNPAANAITDRALQEAADVLGMQLHVLDVRTGDDLVSAFATVANWPAQGVIMGQSALLLTERTHLAELAARSRLPVMYPSTEFVEAGGLTSYGTSQRNMYRRLAAFIDKILQGAKPADLPVEQLPTVGFAVNVKAAQALRLTLPPDVAAQVTEWVE